MTEATIISIVAVIAGVGSCVALILKNIKHSDCCYRCFSIDTRTPVDNQNQNQIISTAPSPQEFKKNKKSKFIKEDSTTTTEISV